ncbi:MAG: nucleoside hydrolase [Hungatella sp.]|nr:nucleoside hydrolase [Hungatella sp.]
MEKRKIILDCDPGHDDAIAILMARSHPGFELLGISTVCGNTDLEKTTRNALNVCQWLKLETPVYKGCTRPLVRDVPRIKTTHGKSGLDGPDFPPCTKKIQDKHAVDFIIEQVLQYPKEVTLIVTGPMTNIALAMRKEPEIVPLIHEIVFMGGSWGYGNVTPAAEFNIWADAEAAKIVFTSGVKLTMMGLDLTRQAQCTPAVIDRMEEIGTEASRLFVELMRFFSAGQKEKYGWEGGPVHDSTCIAYLIDPDCIATRPMYGAIDISDGPSYGRTNCDSFCLSGNPANVNVSVRLDAERFWDIVEQCIRIKYK